MYDRDDISIHANDSIVEEYENEETTNDAAGSDENKGRIIDPPSKKRNIRTNIQVLNTKRLKAPKKGIHTIEKYFEGFKFYGKGHEKKDLNRIMKRLEHWGHRLYPKFHFDDFLVKCEKLGSKKDLQVFVKKYRLDMIDADYDETKPDDPDDNNIDDENDKNHDVPMDEFDMLLEEQLEKTKQIQSTPNLIFDCLFEQSGQMVPPVNLDDALNIENNTQNHSETRNTEISEAVKMKIEKNRQEALRRRAMRLEALSKERSSHENISLANQTQNQSLNNTLGNSLSTEKNLEE